MRHRTLVLMAAAVVVFLAGGLSPIEADSSLRERINDDPDPGQPSYVLAGQNASLQYWKTPDGTVSQALYRSADDTVSVRTFYDEATGLPRRISDELSGNWVLIQENGADSIDMWFYDRDGSYRNGFAVFEDAGQYFFGEIAGLPVHAGKEITGDLVPTTASWTGSFTLDVDTGDLRTRRPVAADMAALMDDVAPDGALLSGLSAGSLILLGLGLVDGFSKDAVAPADMAAFEALAGGRAVVFTYADSGYAPSVEFRSAGRFVRTDQNDSWPGDFSYVRTGAGTGTISLTFDPDNDPDEYEQVLEVRFTSGTAGAFASTYTERGQEPVVGSGRFKIADGVATDGMATAGAAALVTSLFLPDVAAGNRYKCTRLRSASSRDVCRLAADFLAHDGEGGPAGLVRAAVDWARDKPGRLADRIDRGKEALANVAGALSPDDAIHERQEAEPLASETPPPIGSRVSGEASGPGGTVAQVEGDITPDGDFAVTGDDDDDLPVVVRGGVGDDDAADSGDAAPTLAGTGASPLRAALGNVVVAGDTPGDAAAFAWGGDSGAVRGVRSAVVLQGEAPVVVRKIGFLQGPSDGSSVTLDLSEYFSDPNGDSMRFVVVASGFQDDLDVRVSGSMLSVRQVTPGGSITTRLRVTATDPGGLRAETSFPLRTFQKAASLWGRLWDNDDLIPAIEECTEYVVLDADAHERQRLRGPDDSVFINFTRYIPLDRLHETFTEGLVCPDSFLAFGGCRTTTDWGTITTFFRCSHSDPTYCPATRSSRREFCSDEGGVWTTRRPVRQASIITRIKMGLRAVESWIIKSYDVPVRPSDQPRKRTGPAGTGVRG